ncbi:MAG: twin-arginine translocase subunit TatC [Candidatus Omnitrophota bacterium]|nr:MAG: twin-arginine translocase subunit TatC [Candidatus Omnitrophota bacterium]
MKGRDESYSFLEHLEELRRRIIYILIIISISSLGAYKFYPKILKFINLPLKKYQPQPVFTNPVEPFLNIFKLSIFTGALVSLPLILYQIWIFVSPAFTERERRVFKWIFILFPIFFYIGISFGFFIFVPLTLKILFSFGKGMQPFISIGYYLNFIFLFSFSLGILFNLPVLIGGLSSAGIIDADFLISKRKFSVVGAFILSAVLTPTTDILTQIFLAIPILILYEISILFAKILKSK